MEPILHTIFWLSALAIAATYFLYPMALLALGPLRSWHRTGTNMPSVTLVISAYNEEAVIREKLENALALNYPRDRLEIMVISDGSADATDAIAAEYADRGIVLHRQQPRRGKSAGLTQFVPLARGEIVIFSDANSMYDAHAVQRLVRNFEDPQVGFVVGHQRYIEEQSPASASESLYWRYETSLKIQESRIGSVVCGDGAIYAIRASLFEPLREDDINDFTIPLKIVARGYRGVFDSEAVCYEKTAADFGGEFRRKVRIVNRSFRAVLRVRQALNPFRVGIFAFQLAIHKLLRWFVPFFLAALLAANIGLAWLDWPFYQATLALQIAFYLTALMRLIPGPRDLKPVYIAYYFCIVNAAAAVGVLGTLFGRNIAVWNPERTPSSETVTATGA
jgi:cellulose synthase/poly-beta-1,6-N-acetylglucosamine synthase-like glycosyltransferase